MRHTIVSFNELKGKTLTQIKGKIGDESINFTCSDGTEYQMIHRQDCCETVTVEDICGDLSNLIDTPILQADESTSEINPVGVNPPERQSTGNYRWTFYILSTVKGSVTIRWYGS